MSDTIEFKVIRKLARTTRIRGKEVTTPARKFFICMDCEHWINRSMYGERAEITCICKCHDLKPEDIYDPEEECQSPSVSTNSPTGN